jgi:hypothetical protein
VWVTRKFGDAHKCASLFFRVTNSLLIQLDNSLTGSCEFDLGLGTYTCVRPSFLLILRVEKALGEWGRLVA